MIFHTGILGDFVMTMHSVFLVLISIL